MGEGNSLVTTLPHWKTDIPVKLCVGAFHTETKTVLKVNSASCSSCSAAALWRDEDILSYTHRLPDTSPTEVPGRWLSCFCPRDAAPKALGQGTPSHASPNLSLLTLRSQEQWAVSDCSCFNPIKFVFGDHTIAEEIDVMPLTL